MCFALKLRQEVELRTFEKIHEASNDKEESEVTNHQKPGRNRCSTDAERNFSLEISRITGNQRNGLMLLADEVGCPGGAQGVPRGCPGGAQGVPRGCPGGAQGVPSKCPESAESAEPRHSHRHIFWLKLRYTVDDSGRIFIGFDFASEAKSRYFGISQLPNTLEKHMTHMSFQHISFSKAVGLSPRPPAKS